MTAAAVALVGLAVALRPPSQLGVAEGRCRANEPGPAVLVTAAGLRDRQGHLTLEIYPPDDRDFLVDDRVLIEHGKVFRRVYAPLPPQGPVRVCIRVPRPGPYSLSLLHDRDSNAKFGFLGDGIGFAGNPQLGWFKPRAEAARVNAGPGITAITVVMNYRHGLFSFSPLRSTR